MSDNNLQPSENNSRFSYVEEGAKPCDCETQKVAGTNDCAINDGDKKRAKKKIGMPIKIVCYTAIFVALSAVTNIYTAFVGTGGAFALSFTYIPNFFAGALLGPLPGFITGILGDLIGCWIAPKGDINPIILLASGLLGLIPGVVFTVFKKSKRKGIQLLAAIISLVLTFAICSTVNTIGLYVFYFKGAGKTLAAVFALRMPKQAIIWAVNSALILLAYYPIKKLIKI